MDFKLELNQELKLILTQEMKMSIKILQMPSISLKGFIEKERQNNPALDVFYSHSYSSGTFNRSSSEENYSFLDYTYEKENFYEYLEKQLLTFSLDKKTKEICVYILNNLDHRGYLMVEEKDIMGSFKISKGDLKKAFDVVHSLEPVGVGAKNLKECLKIQLNVKNISDKYLISIIDYFLEELGDGNFDYISQKLNIDCEKIKDYLKIIQTLNPIPARGFDVEVKNNFIVPEGSILVGENGEIITSINEEAIPKVRLNGNYIPDSSLEKQNINKALMVIKCIEKRYETLKKILDVLGEKQKKFFLEGKEHLEKLVLDDVASIIGVHPSTVSRSINSKYIYSSQGTIPLRMLFRCSSKSIQIKKIIEEAIKVENKEKPLSDKILASKVEDLLKETVARRTVAKYREELGIASTRERKIKKLVI